MRILSKEEFYRISKKAVKLDTTKIGTARLCQELLSVIISDNEDKLF